MTIDDHLSVTRPRTGFTVVHRPSMIRGGLACWLGLPNIESVEAPPLVAIHGVRRGARAQAELLAERAASLGRTVIAPIFDVDNWPHYQQVVRKQRADLALISLMTELRRAGIWGTRTFDLAGYSGGAQYAHRFAMLYPCLLSRLTVASAGWYTFPDSTPFPYGLGASNELADDRGPQFTARLDQFLRLPIQVCVGAKDNVPDRNTRSGRKIDRQQGKDRLTRAKRWVASLSQAASKRGIAPCVTLSILPGCGHNFRLCVQQGELDRLVLPVSDPHRRPPIAAAIYSWRDQNLSFGTEQAGPAAVGSRL